MCSLRLQNNTRLTFVPCSLSQNGTTIIRGQIPFLLYATEVITEGTKRKHASQEAMVAPDKSSQAEEPTNHLFVLIIRLLAQKVSMITSMGEILSAERRVCSQLVSYATVFVESRPDMAFYVMAAFDEVIPLITSANAELTSSVHADHSRTGNRCKVMSNCNTSFDCLAEPFRTTTSPYKRLSSHLILMRVDKSTHRSVRDVTNRV